MNSFPLIICLVFCLAVSFGCALQEKEAQKLLARDYATMSGQELESYYFRLNDQLAAMERQSRRGGGWREEDGATADRNPLLQNLRQRRNAVRSELGRRGLRP